MLNATYVGVTAHVGMLILLRVGFSFTQWMDGFPNLPHTSFTTISIMRTESGADPAFIQTLHQGILVGPFGPGISKYRPLIPIVVIVVILIYEPKGITRILARGSRAIKRMRQLQMGPAAWGFSRRASRLNGGSVQVYGTTHAHRPMPRLRAQTHRR